MSDLAAVRAKSEAQLEREIADDPEFQGIPEDWFEAAVAISPGPKRLLSLRIDAEVVEWFKQRGPGYQTRMNAVLRAYMQRDGKPGQT